MPINQHRAASRIAEQGSEGALVQPLREGEELWTIEHHASEYLDLTAVDLSEPVLAPEGEKLIANSDDFNYAVIQTVRETDTDFESFADEIVIYRGNVVKISRPDLAQAIFLGYLKEVASEDYQLTVSEEEATHGLIDVTGLGDLEIVPIAELDGSVRVRRIGADIYRIY